VSLWHSHEGHILSVPTPWVFLYPHYFDWSQKTMAFHLHAEFEHDRTDHEFGMKMTDGHGQKLTVIF
jgi:hypothetical protein